MKVGNLFNGIGGFALAAHWMGWENVMHCEIDPFCNRVMKHHFPNSFLYEDIRKTDFTFWRGSIDILTGGFPCQPYSTAGKRFGKADARHLWPENFRAIRQIQPPWVVGENVRGLTNWNGGLVFDEVQADLEAEGYEVLPFLLPAAGVNAPHRRDRIWFIAYDESKRRREEGASIIRPKERTAGNGGEWVAANTSGQRRQQVTSSSFSDEGKDEGRQTKYDNIFTSRSQSGLASNSQGVGEREQANEANAFSDGGKAWIKPGGTGMRGIIADTSSFGGIQGQWQSEAGQFDKTDWQQFPTQSPLCSRNDGLSSELDGITIPRHRRESIKAAGNAIVPQVAYQLFKTIEAITKTNE